MANGQLKRVFGPALLTNAAATVYTVPAGESMGRAQFHFFNEDTVARTITLSYGADAAGTRLYMTFSIASMQPYDWNAMQPLEAAEIIQAYADVTNKVTLTIGAEVRVI